MVILYRNRTKLSGKSLRINALDYFTVLDYFIRVYILGINPSHNATAALMKDGKITACVSEEKFNHIKNFWGFPKQAINFCMEYAKIEAKDLDLVVVSSTIFPATPELGNDTSSTVPLYKTYRLVSNFTRQYLEWHFPKLQAPEKKVNNFLVKASQSHLQKNMLKLLKEYGINNDKVLFADHHLCHTHSALYGSLFAKDRDGQVLIITLDAEGDSLSSTISTFKNKRLKRISSTDQYNSLGYFYSAVTEYLGMKPNEHEYKVMGLAPYAPLRDVERIYQKIKDWVIVDPSGLTIKTRVPSFQFLKLLKQTMQKVRFDYIAGAAQMLCERVLTELISASVKKTKITTVVLGGGVFMNVKANKLIAELPGVKKLFIFPSCGDESNAIGACYLGHRRLTHGRTPEPIKDLYLGPEYTVSQIDHAIKKTKNMLCKKPRDVELEAAKLLAKGEIIARFNGRTEWGARALGNRSILANASIPEVVEIINKMIKNRDFWMPFAPMIIDEDKTKYLKISKNSAAEYMIMAFDTKEEYRTDLIAAIHPYDKTARPQVLSEDWNPSMWKLLKNFKKITGKGGILNTSFNIHGEPIVNSPEDALSTFVRSGLKYLILGPYLVTKNK